MKTPQIYQSARLGAVDAARGVALVAMTLFHFGWDLEMFGFAGPGFASQPAMIWFARVIASSFLFLVGVSLVLAHGRGIRWPSFARRLATVGAAAALITIATWFATPDAYIFFGILHHIALASVIGLAFLRLPWWLTAIAGAAVLFARMYLRTPLLDAPLWWWTGLSAFTPRSNDFVPMAPFLAMVLFGIAAARLGQAMGAFEWLSQYPIDGKAGRLLRFIGRHSLVYYLLHQPVMIAILFVVQYVTR